MLIDNCHWRCSVNGGSFRWLLRIFSSFVLFVLLRFRWCLYLTLTNPSVHGVPYMAVSVLLVITASLNKHIAHIQHAVPYQTQNSIQFNKLYSERNITENIKNILTAIHDHDWSVNLPSGSRQGRLLLDTFNINYTVIWILIHNTK